MRAALFYAPQGTPAIVSTISSTDRSTFGGPVGNEALIVEYAPNTVNHVSIFGATTGNGPSVVSTGADANITLNFTSKGNFGMGFYTNNFGSQHLSASHTANTVNRFNVTGSATGSRIVFSAQGSDSNIGIFYNTKGTENHVFTSNSGALQFVVAGIASTVNWVQAHGSTAGNACDLAAVGADVDIDLSLTTKGAGRLRFGSYTADGAAVIAGYILIRDLAGNSRKLLVAA